MKIYYQNIIGNEKYYGQMDILYVVLDKFHNL